MLNIIKTIAIWLCLPGLAYARSDLPYTDSTRSGAITSILLEQLLEQDEQSDKRNELLFDELRQLELRPVPINTASFRELLTIPFLSAKDARRIIDYRSQNSGSYNTISDLKPILAEKTLGYIAPFITFDDPDNTGMFKMDLLSRAKLETPAREGFSNGAYKGSRPKTYHRLQLQYSDHIFISALMEKDSGEKSYHDFSAFGLAVKDINALKLLVLGNYHLRFGQGLAITTDRYFFKSPEIYHSVKQSGSRSRIYASSREWNYFTGAVAELEVSPINMFLFYSKTKRDASVTDSGFTSLKLDGLHRTDLELNKKNQIDEQTLGSHLEFFAKISSVQARFGTTVFQTTYNKPYLPEPILENHWRFRGRKATIGSLDLDLTINETNVFGELAYSHEQQARSFLVGLRSHINPRLSFSAVFRNYSPAFYSPYASAFAESGDDARNERGIYLGLGLKLSKNISISTYYDHFSFPYITGNTLFPANGFDYVLSVNMKLSPSLQTRTMFQIKEKDDSRTQADAFGDVYRQPAGNHTLRLKQDFIYKIAKRYRLKTRVEVKTIRSQTMDNSTRETGWLIYEELAMKTNDWLDFTCRIAWFSTPSFNSAIYAYEPDLPLLASTKAHYGNGHRLILNARYRFSGSFSLSARIANTYRADVTEMGSGNETIPSNSPLDLGLALQASF